MKIFNLLPMSTSYVNEPNVFDGIFIEENWMRDDHHLLICNHIKYYEYKSAYFQGCKHYEMNTLCPCYRFMTPMVSKKIGYYLLIKSGSTEQRNHLIINEFNVICKLNIQII